MKRIIIIIILVLVTCSLAASYLVNISANCYKSVKVVAAPFKGPEYWFCYVELP